MGNSEAVPKWCFQNETSEAPEPLCGSQLNTVSEFVIVRVGHGLLMRGRGGQLLHADTPMKSFDCMKTRSTPVVNEEPSYSAVNGPAIETLKTTVRGSDAWNETLRRRPSLQEPP